MSASLGLTHRAIAWWGVMSAACCASVRGDFIVTPSSGGAQSVSASPGDVIAVDVMLGTSAADVLNAAILRLSVSEPGLLYMEYAWNPAFSGGSLFDDSTPSLGQLPMAIVPQVLQGPAYPAGESDVELSNALPLGTVGGGLLVQLHVQVPAGWQGSSVITLTVSPDTLSNGFDEIPSASGPPLEIHVIPAPGAGWLFMAGATAMCRRRRG